MTPGIGKTNWSSEKGRRGVSEKSKQKRERERDRGVDSRRGRKGENEGGLLIDCAGTCTITGGWSHVSGLNSPFARYNGSAAAVGST